MLFRSYAQGVKANVLFFERRAGSAQAATKRLWVYDLRTNKHFTLKTRPLQPSDLEEFVQLYKPGTIAERQPTWSEANPEGRWRAYELEELLARDKLNLDLFWLKDESLLDADNLPDPDRFLFDKGVAALTDKHWTDAREYYRQVVDNYPQSPLRPEAKLGIGDSYLGEKRGESLVMAANEYREFQIGRAHV